MSEKDENDARKVRLAVYDQKSSLRQDGSRNYVQPADVSGRFLWARRAVFAALIVLWAALPWVHVNGRPAMFLDVPARRFFLFGSAFNAQDFWLVFFFLTALLFGLVVVTTLLGRVWCGWACPQTVFLEGFFRPIERWIEGPRNERMRRDAGPMNFDKLWRKGLKQLLYVAVAAFVAHVFLAYFVSLPSVLEFVTHSPAEHPTPFIWMAATTGILWFNFAWFREQLCLVICPYGRLQSILMDDDSMVVGYDEKRGEPRGKAKKDGVGDCVDCNRCVVVCPTGIDIRNGLQVDCIACTQCIDACDEIMDKVHKPRGLIRYDSLRGLRHEARRFFRPRLIFYAFLGLVGAGALTLALSRHHPFEAQLLRMPGLPYIVTESQVRNQFDLHLLNKADAPRSYTFEIVDGSPDVDVTLPADRVELDALESRHLTVVVREAREGWTRGRRVRVRVRSAEPDEEPRIVEAPRLGPQL